MILFFSARIRFFDTRFSFARSSARVRIDLARSLAPRQSVRRVRTNESERFPAEFGALSSA